MVDKREMEAVQKRRKLINTSWWWWPDYRCVKPERDESTTAVCEMVMDIVETDFLAKVKQHKGGGGNKIGAAFVCLQFRVPIFYCLLPLR